MSWMLFWLFGCETEERYAVWDTAMTESCADLSYDNVGVPFMTQYCIGCHGLVSSNRQGAPVDVTLDSMDNILEHLDVIRAEILLETMPPSGGVTQEGIDVVVQWLDCEEMR